MILCMYNALDNNAAYFKTLYPEEKIYTHDLGQSSPSKLLNICTRRHQIQCVHRMNWQPGVIGLRPLDGAKAKLRQSG